MEETKSKRRPGKTLLLSNKMSDVPLEHECIVDVFTSQNGSKFITCDTVENAEKLHDEMVANNILVKYCYYKVFYKLNNFDLERDNYDNIKNIVKAKLVESNNDINVIYFKCYIKNNKLTGAGDFTIDSKEDLDALIKSRQIDFDDKTISLYRFKSKPRHRN